MLICSLAFGVAQAGLRVATYNLENYLIMDRLVDGHWKPEYPKPEPEKAALRAVIRAAQADILVLQEIGGPGFLRELQADLETDGLHYPFGWLLTAVDEERQVAVLSRIKATGVRRHLDMEFKYFDSRMTVGRGLLELSFPSGAPGDAQWHLFALHLKSKYTIDDRDPESEILRVKEAEACRNRILERIEDSAIDACMVIGDFNDFPDTPTLRRFYQKGSERHFYPIAAVDSRGEWWTYFNRRQQYYNRLDYILVSSGLRRHVVAGSGRVSDIRGAMDGSDHRMVIVDLEW